MEKEISKGDILVKIVASGFRSVGSRVEVTEVKDGLVRILYLPRNEDALLGNDESWYGIETLNKLYKKDD